MTEYPYYVVYDGYITSKAKGSLDTSKPFMYRYPTAEENTVTLAEFRDAKARRARINSILPEDLILLDDEGKEIEMSKKQREDFKFTGLSTIDMIDCEWRNSETENLKIF